MGRDGWDDMTQHAWMRTVCSLTCWLAACGPEAPDAVNGAAPALEREAECWQEDTTAMLRDAAGSEIGRVSFSSDCANTLVTISVQLPHDQAGTIHGIHVHANDKPENGEGCQADPSQPASTHFVTVDGHYSPSGGSHGHHTGDLPAVFVNHEGRGWMQFLTDQFQADELLGRAVILHAAADNYGNVPAGEATNQYTPNDPAATELTANTGNAGARIGCGVIE
jgi:superoxide dismutase, Cu-Zn family